MKKRCSYCKEEKDISAFSSNGRGTCLECQREAARRWRRNNLEKSMRQASSAALKKNYGITIEDYERMYKEQNGMCACCKKHHNGKRRMHVDHNHRTGKVRALLCHSCNVALGAVNDNKYMLENLLRYLDIYESVQSVQPTAAGGAKAEGNSESGGG